MENKKLYSDKHEKVPRHVEGDMDQAGWQAQLKKIAKPKQQPPPAKNVGDDTPNPLPDQPNEDDSEGGGDPGRTS